MKLLNMMTTVPACAIVNRHHCRTCSHSQHPDPVTLSALDALQCCSCKLACASPASRVPLRSRVCSAAGCMHAQPIALARIGLHLRI